MTKYPVGLCDLHCDTLYKIAGQGDLCNDTCHVSFDRVDDFAYYAQVMALWNPPTDPDDLCYERFLKSTDHLHRLLMHHPDVSLCTSYRTLADAASRGKKAVILSVEGGGLLGGDLMRLDEIYARGVRLFTPVWGGVSCMGGAHDVGGGLSPFGILALKKMLSLGMIPDVSHASKEIFYQIAAYADMMGMPMVATHSNSAVICPHTRNLSDEQFRMIRDAGGVVGISFCIPHLSENGAADVGTVADHIEHYLSLDGEHTVCIGADLDGIDALPAPMNGIEDMGLLYEELQRRRFSDALISDIFCGNAMSFWKRHLK
ncbi:MAG: membrane dipeptidase [Clostridia bacterium]|nr:membrane dipeptidase [Clostridia bacterium]